MNFCRCISIAKNQIGQTVVRTLNGAVKQTYEFFYKDNKTKDLDYVTLPNGLNYCPQNDMNGRDTGKILKVSDNGAVYGEYVYYRKAGNRGTNMPSSVYYGKTMLWSYDNFVKDIQGNVISVLDTTGREVVHYFYDAWGNFETSVLDEAHAAIARLNPFRYRGYYYDTETNLYYLNTRYYDPETGRFISADDTMRTQSFSYSVMLV